MPNKLDRKNSQQIKEAFGLSADTLIQIKYGNRERIAYTENPNAGEKTKNRSGELTDEVTAKILSGRKNEPDPSQLPQGKRSNIEISVITQEGSTVIFRQERDETVTVNKAYEREADKAVETKLPEPAQVNEVVAAEVRSRDDRAASNSTVTLTVPKPEREKSVTIEVAKSIGISERGASKLTVPSNVYRPTGNQTKEERLDKLSNLADQIKARVSKAGRRALENVQSDVNSTREKLQLKASEKLSEFGDKAKTAAVEAKNRAVERAKADSKIVYEAGKAKAKEDFKTTVAAAKTKGAELGVSVIAASQGKIQSALESVRTATRTVDRLTHQAGNWVQRMTKVANDRETARSATEKWKEGNARTGADSFSFGNMNVTKRGDSIIVSQNETSILSAKLDEKGQPAEIQSHQYDIADVRKAVAEPARGSNAVEDLYRAQSEAIAEVAKQSFTVQVGTVELGKSETVPGKSFHFSQAENGDFVITRTQGGQEVLRQTPDGKVSSNLSHNDIGKFANAMQVEQKQEATAVR